MIKDKMTSDLIKALKEDWYNILNDVGGYPDLPFDEERGIVEFKYVREYPGINKTTIYNRILEWSAINFGSLAEVLYYENPETGKIVIKGSMVVPYLSEYKNFWGIEKDMIGRSTCTETVVLTIIDGKLKIELSDLEFVFSYWPDGFLSTPVTTYSTLNDLYPVVTKEPDSWRGRLSLLKESKNTIGNIIALLDEYILNYADDYVF